MRVALVTGGARGIGAATVRKLAEDGWAVLACDIAADIPELGYPMASEAELHELVASSDGTVKAHVADVRDADAMHAAVAEAEREWGRIDAAVACAGAIAGGVPLWEMPTGAERAVLEVNLVGSMNLARAAIPVLLRQPEPRSGRFLAVASTAATHGLPMLASYCAAKAGVVGLVRALAAELGCTGVTANAVSPGSTSTPILEESARLYGLPDTEEFAQHQSVNRLLEPAEIANVLAFMAGQ
ncbi:MAG: SDR family oxidoreductase, partial [Frankiaceae bacterium]|nr:SDR family oxidoreductase [Frankiaceae bacterium]